MQQSFLCQNLRWRYYKTNSWWSFSLNVHRIPPVIANAALYWTLLNADESKHSSLTVDNITVGKESFRSSHRACNFIKKETLAQVFSCEFCEISKNTFFTEYLLATGSRGCMNDLKIVNNEDLGNGFCTFLRTRFILKIPLKLSYKSRNLCEWQNFDRKK